ncbi:MAG: alpha/beta hydrolase-fold protein [Pseudomonadota bacterium]
MICAILAITAAAPANARQEFSIQSESTDDTREIIVHLPTDYDPDRDEGYPVIYMLDAGSKDKLTAEIASYYYWGDLMPELIVVGLKNVNRGLDFLPHYYDVENNDGEQVYGNGDKLLAYIENELIPFVDNQFNTNGDNSFSGHSWGGQFLTYALSQSPGLFDAYFITSPSFGSAGEWSQKTFDALELALKRDYEFPDLVYVSVGGDGAPGALSDAGLLPEYYRLVGLLRRHLPEQVELRHEIHDIANHTSNGAISMAKALQLYFAAAPVSE